MQTKSIKSYLLAAMLAASWGANASDFMVDELCYNITDAVAKTVEVAEYDYKVDGQVVRPTNTEVVVPATVTNPNDGLTYRVTALGENSLMSTYIRYTKITLPEGLLAIKQGAFTNQRNVTELVLPSTLKTIETTFSEMYGLTELSIPESVESMTSIESLHLKKLTIKGCPTIHPRTLGYVTGSGEYEMTYLFNQSYNYNVDIVLESTTPPVLPELSAIYYSDLYNSRFSFLHVPNGCSDAYNNATGWNLATVVAEGYGDPDEYKTVNNIRYYRDSHRAIGVSVAAPIEGTLRVPSSILFDNIQKRLPVERLASKMLQRGDAEALAGLNITDVYFGQNMKILDANALYSDKVKVDLITIPATVEYVGRSFVSTSGMRMMVFEGAPKIARQAIESVQMVRFMSETLPTVEDLSLSSSKTRIIAPNLGSIAKFEALFPENSVFTGYAQADGISYALTKDNTVAAICSSDALTEATIRASIAIDGTTMPVKRVYDGLFSFNSKLVKVTLPEGLTDIGYSVFYYCEKLADIQLPSSIETIGGGAFMMCKKWKGAVVLPHLKSLGYQAFRESAVVSADFTGSQLTAIPDEAFYKCQNFKSIVIPEGVTTIGNAPFYDTYLTSLTLPSTLTSIVSLGYMTRMKTVTCNAVTPPALDNYQPFNCMLYVPFGSVGAYRQSENWNKSHSFITSGVDTVDGLSYYFGDTDARLCGVDTSVAGTDIVIPEQVVKDSHTFSVNSIAEGAFQNSKVETVTVPSVFTEIPNSTFGSCKALTKVTLPDGLTSIGVSAFANCSELTEINVPESVTSIGETAFYNCQKATTLTVPSGLTSLGRAAYKCSGLSGALSFPLGITEVTDDAFCDTQLTSVTLHDGVTKVGSKAFFGCSELASLSLNEGLTTIGYEAFKYCNNIADLVLPTTLNFIDRDAFSLVNKRVESRLAEPFALNSSMFSKCTIVVPIGSVDKYKALSSNGWDASNNYVTFDGEADGLLYQADDAEAWLVGAADGTTSVAVKDELAIADGVVLPVTRVDCTFKDNKQIQSISIPAAVTSLGAEFASGCEALQTVTFRAGSQLQTIGASAFQGTALQAIEIPEGVTALPDKCFYQCASLESIDLLGQVGKVGMSCFYQCTALKSVDFGDETVTLGKEAFYNCTNLETVACSNPFVIADDDRNYGYEFYGCRALKAVRVSSMSHLIRTFYDCTSLASVGIEEGCIDIGLSSFENCTSLKRIVLPSTVQYVGSSAFDGVELTELTCLAVTPPTIASQNAFSDYTARLCVPAESIDAYSTANYWQLFGSIGDLSTSNVATVAGDGVTVTAEGRTIRVGGLEDSVMIKVYSTSGKLIYVGTDRMVEVPNPGFYVVQLGSGARKVAVM